MGNLRKALHHLAPVVVPTPHSVIRRESSAEQAAREQAALTKEQNAYLAVLAGSPAPAPATVLPPRAKPGEPACCVECIHRGCDKRMGNNPGRTYRASRCDCKEHH
jgi:hypothetical protein